MQRDVLGWLTHRGIESNAQSIEWATQMFHYQPPETIHAMSKDITAETNTSD